MTNWKHALWRLAADETAVTSIEYALVASLIAVVCTATVAAVGDSLGLLYLRVCNEVTTAISHAPAC